MFILSSLISFFKDQLNLAVKLIFDLSLFYYTPYPKKYWQKGILKITKKTLTTYLIVSTLFFGTGLIYLFGPFTKKTEAVWFDDNWGYRQLVPITDNTGVDTNTYISFTLDTATLITATKLQSSCQDIRVTDAGGNLLDYHVGRTNACNASNTTIDALVPTLAAGASTFYVYYGNPTAASKDPGAFSQSEAASYTVGTKGTATNAQSPTLYWKFDDTTVTTAEDSTTNGLDGTHNNTPTIRTEDFCVSGKCLYLDGSNNENISRADNAKLDFGATDNFTVTAWVKRNGQSTDVNYILTKHDITDDTEDGGYKLWMDADGDFCFGIDDDITWGPDISACSDTNADFDDDKWHHVVGVRDQTGTDKIYVYVDGLERSGGGTADSTSATLANSNIFYAGVDRDGTSNEWLGFMDEVKVYPYARSAAQITADFNARNNNEGAGTRFAVDPNNSYNALNNGLVGCWKEDETTSGATATDCSGNSNGSTPDTTVNPSTVLSNTSASFQHSSRGTFYNGENFFVLYDKASTSLYARGASTVAGLSSASEQTILSAAKSTSNVWATYLVSDSKFDLAYETVANANFRAVQTCSISGTTVSCGTASATIDMSNNGGTTVVRTPNDDRIWVGGGNGILAEANQTGDATGSTTWTDRANTFLPDGTVSPQMIPYSSSNALLAVYFRNPGGTSSDGFYFTTCSQGSSCAAGVKFIAVDNPAATNFGTAVRISDTDFRFVYVDATATTILVEAKYDGAGNLSTDWATTTQIDTGGGQGQPTLFYDRTGDTEYVFYKDSGTPTSIQRYTKLTASTYATAWTSKTDVDAGEGDNNSEPMTQMIEAPLGSSRTAPRELTMCYMNASTSFDILCDSINLASSGSGGLTDSGTTPRVAGKFGNGADFESGSSQYQYSNDSSALSITGNLTLAAWIKPEAVASGTYNIIAKWDGSNESYRLASVADGTNHEIRLELDSSGNYVQTSSSDLVASTWYHVVGVYNSGSATAKIYINGVEATSSVTGTIPSSIGDDGGRFHIGAEDSSTTAANFYDGVIDGVRVYNRALNSAEVSQLYNFGPGPVGYWKMEETSWNGTASEVKDASGNALHGTANGGASATTTSGKFGRAGNVDGTDDYVDVSNDTLLLPLVDMSVMAWVKFDNLPGDGGTDTVGDIAYKANGATFSYKLALNNTPQICFQWRDSADTGFDRCPPRPTMVAGTWYHVAGVIKDNTMRVYLNGDQAGGTTAITAGSTIDTDTAQSLRIGSASSSSNNLDGRIDDVKFYNYGRSQAQIIEDMNATHPAPGSPAGSATGYWKFDEGYSTTAHDSNITTGDAEDLTLSTASWTNSGKFNKAWNGDGTIWLSRASDADLEFSATEDFTVSMWFKSDSATNPANGAEYLAADTTGNADVGFAIYANTNGTICFGIDDTAGSFPAVSSCTATDYYDGNWHHLTAVRNITADKTYIYIDALEKDSDADTTTATLDGDNVFYLGDFDGDNNGTAGTEEFAGDLDEVKVFRSALSVDQIKTDYNRGSSQVLGALGDHTGTGYESINNANQEYCIPGDTTSCVAPVGRWDFEEGSGSTAVDVSGNASDGTITGATYKSGKIGKALDYAGSTDDTNMSNPAALNNVNTFTWCTWFFARSGGGSSAGRLIHKGADAGARKQLLYTGTDALQLLVTRTANATANTADSSFSLNTWNHVCATYSESDGPRIYLNGKEATYNGTRTVGSGSTTDESGSSFRVGNRIATDRAWDGRIDGVRVYDYIRTPAQIAYDYNRGKPVGWWKLDECQGTTLNDSSGNSNTGTLTIGATGSEDTVGTCTTASTAWLNGVTGKRNYSIDLDGTDDVVTVTNASAIDFDLGLNKGYSFAAWVYAGSDGENDVGEIFDKGSTNYCRVDSEAGGLDLQCSIDLATTDPTENIADAFQINTWNHVVMTYNDDSDDDMEVYINGILRATGNGSGAPQGTDTADLLIGGDTAANFDGQIDDFRVYNYGLTATQVKTLYNDGATRFGPATGAP